MGKSFTISIIPLDQNMEILDHELISVVKLTTHDFKMIRKWTCKPDNTFFSIDIYVENVSRDKIIDIMSTIKIRFTHIKFNCEIKDKNDL